MLYDKLIIYKSIFKDLEYIGFIVVPTSVRRVMFSHYQAELSGAHMGCIILLVAIFFTCY